eukprot:m.42602 g.42602  ORF g.42602 m.42602 type:complete len:594 (+) comp10524_c0_seq3:58-1839(+)
MPHVPPSFFFVCVVSLFLCCCYVCVGGVCDTTCDKGLTIQNSNRNSTFPCLRGSSKGAVCEFECLPGFVGIGTHVCQTYTTNDHLVLNRTFYGGNCNRLCEGPSSSAACGVGQVPLRVNKTDSMGACLHTICFDGAEDALLHIARGNYALWQMARNNETGIYLDHVNMYAPDNNEQGGVGMSGIGVAMEVIAAAMGWISIEEAQLKVERTLQSFANKLPQVHIPRHANGWLPRFINSTSGRYFQQIGDGYANASPSSFKVDNVGDENDNTSQSYSTLSTGLFTAGCLLAKTYFEREDPGSNLTVSISSLAQGVFDMVQWQKLLCNEQLVSDTDGSGIPMVINNTIGCSATEFPEEDGFYQFYENHYTVWLTYEHTCGEQVRAGKSCNNTAVATMWEKWQGRRLHPNVAYKSHPLLSLWSCYLVHLPYYLVHPFNSDSEYNSLFQSHWQADMAYYKSPAYNSGRRGMYGMGAGPTAEWCSGTTYIADRIDVSDPSSAHCRDYSPYCVAGYLPADKDTILTHLLDLLADGQTVYQLPNTAHHILWRRSLLDSSWDQGYGVTMVDFSSELFGLSTLWLGANFFVNNTNHFTVSTNK